MKITITKYGTGEVEYVCKNKADLLDLMFNWRIGEGERETDERSTVDEIIDEFNRCSCDFVATKG